MQKSFELLRKLGVHYATKRHTDIIDAFIENKGTDLKALLDDLGSWDESDMEIAKAWFETL